MSDEPSSKRRIVARAAAAYRTVVVRQRRLERRVERRYPRLYDARHGVSGIGRLLWPLIGPLLAVLILYPLVVVLIWVGGLLGLRAPSIDLPSINLPDIPFPSVTAPGWLRAVGDALGAVWSVLGSAAKYVALVLAVVLGVHRTREARRKRAAAERLGRPELLRRLAITLSRVEARARAQDATTLGAASIPDPEHE